MPDAPTALARTGFGFAIKVDDGAQRAARVIAAAVLQAMLRPEGDASAMLEAYVERPVRSARRAVVGAVRPADALREALAGLV